MPSSATTISRPEKGISDSELRQLKIRRLGDCHSDTFECPVGQLGSVLKSDEANEMVTVPCSHAEDRYDHNNVLIWKGCGTKVRCTRFIANFVGCDECIAKWQHDEAMKIARTHWETICPPRFRDSDINHVDEHGVRFPKEVYLATKKTFLEKNCAKSVFLIGATGSAKTRIGFLLLKQAMFKGYNVGVLWPEDIPKLRTTFDSAVFDRYATIGCLLVDDAMMTACRDSKMTDHLKMLIDVRMRHDLTTIFTSQVGAGAFLKGNKEFGDLQDSDIQRVDAIMRRLREECDLVTFKAPKLGQGESHF